jgi:SAM-dependent methyltransferase
MTSTLDRLIRPDVYPLSSKYDQAWLVDLVMGPNPLWLLEDLAQDLDLRPGMRVLDLGSGMGGTSVFLAREYGVRVVASDWWVQAPDAAAVFAAAGVADQVEAVHAEAHQLPFEEESFDAIVSIDAYEYFGTADTYLPYLLRFLRPGGQLGVSTPGMTHEIRDLGEIPPHLAAAVGWEAIAWHTPDWWRYLWEITGLVEVTSARLQENGWHDWLIWAEVCATHRPNGIAETQPTLDMLQADAGAYLGFTQLTARKH